MKSIHWKKILVVISFACLCLKLCSLCISDTEVIDNTIVFDNEQIMSVEKKYAVEEDYNERHVEVIAHRGFASLAPENSLPAFQLAGEAGFDGIECDVRVTRDGELVIIHDETLSRMCGVNRKVSELTLEEIKQYPIINGSNASEYPENYIITLEEFINCCNSYHCMPVVEIKGNFTNVSLRKVYDAIKKADVPPMVISFYRYNLRWLRKVDKDLRLQNIAWKPETKELKFCREIHAELSTEYTELTPEIIKKVYKYGIPLSIWTVNEQDAFEYYRSLGITAVTTEMDFTGI